MNTGCLTRSDPDHTAFDEAVWSMSSLFAILTSMFRIPALLTNILIADRTVKVFVNLEHLPYSLHVLTFYPMCYR